MFGFIKSTFRRVKGAVFTGAAYLSTAAASWTPRDYDNFAREAYLKNIIAFRCIDLIAKSVASVEWCLKKDDPSREGEKVEDPKHSFNLVLKRPNPKQSWRTLIYYAMSYYLLTGNAFISRVSLSGGINRGKVRELYCHRPSQISMETDTASGDITAYKYQQTAQITKKYEVDPITQSCDMLQIKTFNPLDNIWGLATVEPAAREIDTNNAAVDWHKSLLENQARPGMLLLFERAMTDSQYQKLKEDIRNNREGGNNAGKSLILEGARDVKPYGFSPTEMDFIEGNRDKARMIAAAFGVPAQLLGIKGDSTFANFEQARTIFWEDTVIPFVGMLKEELNAWLFFDDPSGAGLEYELEHVPALSYREAERWKRANESTFIKTNEKRELAGYDSIGPAGDTILISAAVIPLDDNTFAPVDESLGGNGNEGNTNGQTDGGDDSGNNGQGSGDGDSSDSGN